MRAEGPKERPTAVLSVQLSARYVQIRQTAKKIRNTLLRFDVRAFANTYVYMLCALRVPRSERYVELFCSTPRVPWRQQPARPRIKVL